MYESTNYFYQMLCNICYDLLKTEGKNAFFDQQGICFLFELRNNGEKIRKFVFGKFVKTCRELDNSSTAQFEWDHTRGVQGRVHLKSKFQVDYSN